MGKSPFDFGLPRLYGIRGRRVRGTGSWLTLESRSIVARERIPTPETQPRSRYSSILIAASIPASASQLLLCVWQTRNRRNRGRRETVKFNSGKGYYTTPSEAPPTVSDMASSRPMCYLSRKVFNTALFATLGAQAVVGFGLSSAAVWPSRAGLRIAGDGALISKTPQGCGSGYWVCSGKPRRRIQHKVVTCKVVPPRKYGSSVSEVKPAAGLLSPNLPPGQRC